MKYLLAETSSQSKSDELNMVVKSYRMACEN